MQNFIEGFLISASLIIAIGAQNAFVLRQGLLRSHVLVIVLICSLSDALLFLFGVAGVGSLINNNITLLRIMTICGIVFLVVYGMRSVYRVWQGNKKIHLERRQKQMSMAKAVSSTLALTYLNPHVYLDTVVIFGSISAPLPWIAKWQLLAGACLSSLLWFFGLGYGARLLTTLFQRERVWRILDALIALIMFWIAGGLFVYLLNMS